MPNSHPAPFRASIIIPTYNNAALTAACLQAIADRTGREDYEVVIVDNASTDDTAALLDQLEGDVVIIRNPINTGFAHASNQGAKAAQADVLVFMNNDIEAHQGWLSPLLDVLDRRPDVGAVGALLLYPDGLVQHAGAVLVENRDRSRQLEAQHVFYRQHPDVAEVRTPRDCTVVTAALVAVRRSAFEQAGGFDEGYWNGYEDVDLCLTLGSLGWRVTYQPASVLTHHESVSGPERFSKLLHNEERLINKWADRVLPEVLVEGGVAVPHPARFVPTHSR